MSRPKLSRLGYGAANLGNLYREIDEDQCWSILNAAWDTGIRYFDTAPHYGLGLSERRLGAFLATKPRAEFSVSTKVGRLLRPTGGAAASLDLENDFVVPADHERVWDFSREGIRRSLDESLERIGLDRVDVLYLHDPEKYDLAIAETDAYPALAYLRDEGLVTAVGVGSMSVVALERATVRADLDIMMVAGRITLLEQPALDGVVARAQQVGIDIVAAGVFNSGVLATNEPGKRYEYGSTPPHLVEKALEIAQICRAHSVDLPTAALQYPLRVRSIRSVVVGGSTPQQVTENSSRMAEEIPEGLWSDLAESGLIP
ncbi:D-threo-aldose 1-dehydrogenase [Salinibacterium sp. CAN_S4]|uniref:aldo/keto reductase n=1 Tax=Salinibacterium sp. CAN_S4 TaxID=2787727 RepID=UPI0018EFAE18